MPDLLMIAFAAVVSIALVTLLILVLRKPKRNEPSIEDVIGGLMTSQREVFGRIEQLAGALAQSRQDQSAQLGELTRAVNERLDGVSQRVSATLSEQGTKTFESLGKLQERLSAIDEAQKNLVELSGQVVSLQDILANKQARGAFGQIQMEDIVRKALPPSAYTFQHTLSNARRCDCIVRLPQPPGSIVIDAKFPLEPFHLLRAAKTEADGKEASRLFRLALLKHVDDIATKYIIAGETAESALLFLPSEAVYAELHASFPDVVERSHTARVYIVSPTTLMATLNTVRAVLKDARMREQAHVIQREVGKLAMDVSRLTDRVGNLRTHFNQAERDIKEIEISADKIQRVSGRIEEVQLEPVEEKAIKAVREQPTLPLTAVRRAGAS